MSKHGVFVYEEPTVMPEPVRGYSSVQVVIGTAPVNMAKDPSKVVNVPILANTAAEAMAALGFSDDFKKYTLCQTMYATSKIYPVSPVVYINVLDPATHKKALTEVTATVSQMQAVVKEKGIILDGLDVKADTIALKNGEDYTTEFDSEGNLVINLITGGKGATATTLKVSGSVLDPSMVDAEDIIGSHNEATGKETGAELIRMVYPRLGVVPGLILAPGWSHNPEVGIALMAKAALINGVFRSMALLDLDTTEALKYTDCKQVKDDSGYTSPFCYPLWPCVKSGKHILAMSAVAGALIAYTDIENGDVPSRSPSNKLLGVEGACLADGTEVTLDQEQASDLNAFGVTTAINLNGWKLFGNYTGAYPEAKDAKDIWFPVRRMFNWQGNTFIQVYFEKVDDPMNSKLIESVVDSENIRCAAYVPDKWAGASIEYKPSDNPLTDILDGKMTFRQRIAPYTPAQEIDNILSYDTSMLVKALTGGEA